MISNHWFKLCSVEKKGMFIGLWSNTTSSYSNAKRKKVVETSKRLGEISTINSQIETYFHATIDSKTSFSSSISITSTSSLSLIMHLFISLWLLKLVWDHSWHIQELLFPNHWDHTFISLRDSTLHLAWLWLKLFRSFKMLDFWFH